MEIRVLEPAKDDLREGWRFYDHRAEGLGDYFLDCMQADVRSLRIYAGIHEMAEGFHRMLVKRVPSNSACGSFRARCPGCYFACTAARAVTVGGWRRMGARNGL